MRRVCLPGAAFAAPNLLLPGKAQRRKVLAVSLMDNCQGVRLVAGAYYTLQPSTTGSRSKTPWGSFEPQQRHRASGPGLC